MSAWSVTEPSARSKGIAAVLVILYTVITLLPLVWIIATGFKTGPDSISYPPKVIFQPSLEGYVNLFTDRTRATPEQLAAMPPPENFVDEIVQRRGEGKTAAGDVLTPPVITPARLSRWTWSLDGREVYGAVEALWSDTGTGTVKAEYARAGQWKAQPGAAPSAAPAPVATD